VTAPKVSVAMIAYNHEQFVVQAVESVLAQRTDFPFEIVFGEDCSPDGTRALVQRLADTHAGRIRLLLPERNIGMGRNLAVTIAACRGDYIALLEGDDYWTDPEKLQRQVEMLDAHPECAVCFTRALVVDEANRPIETAQFIREVKPTYTLADYLSRVFQPRTCTVMFRRGLFAEFPKWFFHLPVADFPLHVLNAEHGDFAFIDCITAAYRIHAGGIWSMGISPTRWQVASREQQLRIAARLGAVLDVYATLDAYLGPRYRAIMRRQMAQFAHQFTIACRSLEDWPRMRRGVRRQVCTLPLPPGVPLTALLRAALVSHCPFLARRP
jgi:glycosyltransferase involved in cell wall biosynthesis